VESRLHKYISLIFCVVVVCANLMNARYNLHMIRAEVDRLNPNSFHKNQTKRYCDKRTNIYVISTLVEL
jgi:hypothetical protein